MTERMFHADLLWAAVGINQRRCQITLFHRVRVAFQSYSPFTISMGKMNSDIRQTSHRDTRVDRVLLCRYDCRMYLRRNFFCFAGTIAAALSVANLSATAAFASSGKVQADVASVVRHARGSFEVTVKPESDTRFAMFKTFQGGIAGTSKGTMIGDSVVTAYTALERFEGVLDGLSGGFLLLHRGYMSEAEGMNLDIIIAPNSGTGELTGIRGRLDIEIKGDKHFYVLTYSLPTK
jgi:Protein of unknown function (DUF3224)